MILICYDGSPDSKSAIARGGELLRGQPATVLTVWQPFIAVVARAYADWGMIAGMQDPVAIDKAIAEQAASQAEEGLASPARPRWMPRPARARRRRPPRRRSSPKPTRSGRPARHRRAAGRGCRGG